MDLYEIAKRKNTLAFLGSELDRRFFSGLLIDYFSYQLRKFGSDKKLSVILVSDSSQVHSEARVIQNLTDLKVSEFEYQCLEDAAKVQGLNFWENVTEMNQVLVMPCSLFASLLNSSVVHISFFNLIVLNQAHLVLTNSDYMHVAQHLIQASPESTRLLAFCPSLIPCNQDPEVLEKLICAIEAKLMAERELSSDLKGSFRSTIEPICYLKTFNEQEVRVNIPLGPVKDLIRSFAEQMKINQDLFDTDNFTTCQHLLGCILNVITVCTTMGPWCAKELTEIYMKEILNVFSAKLITEIPLSAIFSGIFSIIHLLGKKLTAQLCGYSEKQQLEFVGEKMQLIMSILEDYAPKSHQETPTRHQDNLCGVILVENPVVVRLLYQWLKKLASQEKYGFLNVDYHIVNNEKRRVSKQEEILLKFRPHKFNLLIASDVLEKELDIPRCNLVIRYDLPQSFGQYFNAKKRVRIEGGKYMLFMPKGFPNLERQLSRYVMIENKLKSNEMSDQEIDLDLELLMKDYPPYKTPSGSNASLKDSIQILNRYCLRLPSDSFTKQSPLFESKSLSDGRFSCKIRLPTNSPIRYPIVGPPAPSKSLAKKAAAIEACKALHIAAELNDQLLPVGKESNKYMESLGIKTNRKNREIYSDHSVPHERPGTTKRRQFYEKRVARSLTGPPPVANEPCNLYIFLMKLTCPITEKQNTRGRELMDPADSSKFFGIVTKKVLPRIPDFSVFTRSGEVTIYPEHVKADLIFDSIQIEKIRDFHFSTFSDVLHLVKYTMEFDPENALSSFYVLPLTYARGLICDNLSDNVFIDWEFIDKVAVYQRQDQSKEVLKKKDFAFEHSLFQDAVIKPWYRHKNDQLHFYVAKICYDLKPTSPFPNKSHQTFFDYFKDKYDITIKNLDQPLLDVDHTSARLNLLTPRYVNRKGITLPMSSQKTKVAKRENLGEKQIYVPELCIVHPFPASFWNKAVCLPSILYRINYLLIAEQIRTEVVEAIHIGTVFLKPHKRWPPLDFGWNLAEVLTESNDEKSDDNRNFSPPNSAPSSSSSSPSTSPSPSHPISKSKSKSKSKFKSKSKSKSQSNSKINLSAQESDDFTLPLEKPSHQSVDGLTIDTFDPEFHKVNDTSFTSIGWLNDSPPEDNDFTIDPEVNFDSIGRTKVRITELPDHDTKTNRNITSGSPGDSDEILLKKIDGKWNVEGLPSTVFDLDIPGLSSISTLGGVNLQGLSKDLVKIHTYEDFENSGEENDSDFGESESESSDIGSIEDKNWEQPTSNTNLKSTKESKSNELNLELLIPIKKQKEVVSCLDYTVSCLSELKTYDIYEPNLNHADILRENFVLDLSKLSDEPRGILDADDDMHELGRHLKTIIKEFDSPESSDSSPENSDKVNSYGPIMVGEKVTSFGELLSNRDEIQSSGPQSNNASFINLDPQNSEFDSTHGPSPALILQALTMSNAGDCINLERLETVGDSFLKYAVTVYMYCYAPDAHEGDLSKLRSSQISNLNLFELGSEKKLGELMVACKFEPNVNWLPPCFKVSEKSDAGNLGDNVNFKLSDRQSSREAFHSLLTHHSIPDKSIADCVEALIGAYLISSGQKGALLFMKWLGLKVMDEDVYQENGKIWKWVRSPERPLLFSEKEDQSMRLYLRSNLESFENEILGYQFFDKSYLVQAFTHNSFSDNHVTDCYQRLEFLGDAVLDFLITRHLYDDAKKHSPGELTDLRSALVNNTFFASLAVEYKFNKYLRIKTSELYRVISRFVEYLKTMGKQELREQYSLLLGEADCEQPEDIEVPKALGDVFESVAGAIYLDSGLSLDTVWKVYYRMMRPEIEHYKRNVPKSPIRELLEMFPQKVLFSKPESILDQGVSKMRVSVDVFGVDKFYGVGRNKRLAKCTAAKRALRYLRANKEQEAN